MANWFNQIYSSAYNMVRLSRDKIEKNNYKLEDFEKLSSDGNIDPQSLSIFQKFQKQHEDKFPVFNFDGTSFVNFVYGSVSTNKPVRLSNYRRMAEFPEVSDAVDEICDASINYDENGKVVELIDTTAKFESSNEGESSDLAWEEITKAFDEYIELFDLDNTMFEYMRSLTIDGELAWENLISKDHPEFGIVGVNRLKPEAFEYAFDLKSMKKKGLTVYVNAPVEAQSSMNQVTAPSQVKKQVQGNLQIQQLTPNSNASTTDEDSSIFMPWEQVTYVSTGIFSSDELIVLPVLEKARKAYNQISLIEDSIIIYRLVRAPKRLVFNVDTGNLSRSRAEQEVLKLMKRYQTKKVYNPVTGSVSNDYDPMTLLESFWFAKPAGTGGTTVDTLDTGVEFDDLPDLQHFLRKLYLSLKIPYNRYAEAKATITFGATDNLSYEEYRFAKFVMRLQACFAAGLYGGFVTHLKLKGLWETHKLKWRDLKIQFIAPDAYEAFRQQRIISTRLEQYSAVVQHEEFSKSLAMKKWLKMSDDEVEENWKSLEEDAMRLALIEYKKEVITKSGFIKRKTAYAKVDEWLKKNELPEPEGELDMSGNEDLFGSGHEPSPSPFEKPEGGMTPTEETPPSEETVPTGEGEGGI